MVCLSWKLGAALFDFQLPRWVEQPLLDRSFLFGILVFVYVRVKPTDGLQPGNVVF